jgi:single-strand DNA-binding protein
MGRLTKDPEVRYTQNNIPVANFSIAVNRRLKREGDTETADFFNVVAWNKTGEFVGKYFKKGQQILVSGRIENRNWTDQQGVKHYATDIIAEEVDFAGSKAENNTNNNTENADITDFTSESDSLPF